MVELMAFFSSSFPPPNTAATADWRQLLRPGLQPASRGHHRHRGHPSVRGQGRRHDLCDGLRLPGTHCGVHWHTQRTHKKGRHPEACVCVCVFVEVEAEKMKNLQLHFWWLMDIETWSRGLKTLQTGKIPFNNPFNPVWLRNSFQSQQYNKWRI